MGTFVLVQRERFHKQDLPGHWGHPERKIIYKNKIPGQNQKSKARITIDNCEISLTNRTVFAGLRNPLCPLR